MGSMEFGLFQKLHTTQNFRQKGNIQETVSSRKLKYCNLSSNVNKIQQHTPRFPLKNLQHPEKKIHKFRLTSTLGTG